MSFIIRLKDFSFTDPNLPVLPQLYREGLVAAFRPANNEASLVDLSNNNIQLTKVGSPAFNEFGVQVTAADGYILDVNETASFSMAICYRLEYEIGSVSGTLQVAGSRDDSASPVSGAMIMSGVFASPGPEDPGTRLQHSLTLGLASGSPNNIRGTKIAQPTPGGPPYLSPWQFIVVTYNASNRAYNIYEPAKASTISGTAIASVVRSIKPWKLGLGGTSVDGMATIAELDFYDRVLNPSEVQTVYDYALPYLASKNVVPSSTVIP